MPSRSLWLNLGRLDRQLLAAEDIGIFTDADGTLSEIQERPELASVPEDVASMLGRLNRLYGLVAVVSGRRAEDVQTLVGQEDLLYLGNHGLERRQGDAVYKTPEAQQATEAIANARVELKRELPEAPGLYLEDKESVLAVHYRQCQDQVAIDAAMELATLIGAKHKLRLQHGRRITEIRPPEADKGAAIIKLVYGRGLKQVIYIGDDATDIDAFVALGKAAETDLIVSSVNVAVIGRESLPELKAKADYWVSSVDEVRRFLDWLLTRAERVHRL